MRRQSITLRAEPVKLCGPAAALETAPAEPSDALAAVLRAVTPNDGKEHLVAFALNARGVCEGFEIIASGTVDSVMVYGRDVFAWALSVPCARFVGVAHNHPSGDVTLSDPDKAGSANLRRVGAFIGLDLAWSVVFTHRSGAWTKWTPEGEPLPKPGGEDAEPKRQEPQEPKPQPEPKEPKAAPKPAKPPEPEPAPKPDVAPVDPEDVGQEEPNVAVRMDVEPVSLDALRKALKSVLK